MGGHISWHGCEQPMHELYTAVQPGSLRRWALSAGGKGLMRAFRIAPTVPLRYTACVTPIHGAERAVWPKGHKIKVSYKAHQCPSRQLQCSP